MSPDSHLREWIAELVDRADLDPMGAGQRMREVVGTRRACIGLDHEWVVVSFDGSSLVFSDDAGQEIDGFGATTSAVILGILGATIEASEAIETGLIEVVGAPDEVVRLFDVVEILLDASVRVPELRRLADDFVTTRAGVAPARAPAAGSPTEELELLRRLGVGE